MPLVFVGHLSSSCIGSRLATRSHVFPLPGAERTTRTRNYTRTTCCSAVGVWLRQRTG